MKVVKFSVYPTVILRLCCGYPLVRIRQWFENGLEMEREWSGDGICAGVGRMETDCKKRSVRSGFYRVEVGCLSWLIVKRWSSQIKQIEYFFRQQLPKIINNFLKPKTRRYALFKNQGKDCSLP